MSDYGLTPKGPKIKRLDTILNEMHDSLSEKLGVNTRQNPQSLLNHVLTNVADQFAELWEYGGDIYYSQYPTTAEGISLDNAAAFGGSTRESPAPSYYHILCTGVDGTVVPAGTIIASDTNPATQLVLDADQTIERSHFNKAKIKIAAIEPDSLYSVVLNGTPYSSYLTGGGQIHELIQLLAASITDDSFFVYIDEESEFLCIESVDVTANHSLLLSENLTTETVGTVITFATEEDGDILLPNGVITKIVKSVPGMQSIVNIGTYIAGRQTESDVEFRQSYADKIYSRSSRMVESVRSAILDKCQGVVSCAVYENCSNVVDEMGRWPHSVEAVVEGGDPTEIAEQILESKAGGINTFGDVAVRVPGKYGEDITIRFNRPLSINTWIRVGITMNRFSTMPSNYIDLIKETILESMADLGAGTDVVPQQLFLNQIYQNVSGISYADIAMATGNEQPEVYDLRMVAITPRERAVTSVEMIEVVIDG